jgi:hypothetical protein
VEIAATLGERERNKKIIDEVPQNLPFEIRFANVEKTD